MVKILKSQKPVNGYHHRIHRHKKNSIIGYRKKRGQRLRKKFIIEKDEKKLSTPLILDNDL